jgi:hypothetical protein
MKNIQMEPAMMVKLLMVLEMALEHLSFVMELSILENGVIIK